MGVAPRIPPRQLGAILVLIDQLSPLGLVLRVLKFAHASVLPLLVNQHHAYAYKLALPPSPKLVRSLCFDHANVGPA